MNERERERDRETESESNGSSCTYIYILFCRAFSFYFSYRLYISGVSYINVAANKLVPFCRGANKYLLESICIHRNCCGGRKIFVLKFQMLAKSFSFNQLCRLLLHGNDVIHIIFGYNGLCSRFSASLSFWVGRSFDVKNNLCRWWEGKRYSVFIKPTKSDPSSLDFLLTTRSLSFSPLCYWWHWVLFYYMWQVFLQWLFSLMIFILIDYGCFIRNVGDKNGIQACE